VGAGGKVAGNVLQCYDGEGAEETKDARMKIAQQYFEVARNHRQERQSDADRTRQPTAAQSRSTTEVA